MARLTNTFKMTALALSLVSAPLSSHAAAPASSGPDVSALVKLTTGLDKASGRLEDALKLLGTEGFQCSATYPVLIKVGPKIAENLSKKTRNTDNVERNDYETARFQRDQVYGGVDALLKRVKAEAAKAGQSGDASGAPASLRDLIAKLRTIISQERQFKLRQVAIGLDRRTGTLAEGAMASIRDEKDDAHCVATIKAIADSDAANTELLANMAKLLDKLDAFEKSVPVWAATVKPAPAAVAKAPEAATAPEAAKSPEAPKTPVTGAADCVTAPPANTLPIAGLQAVVEKLPKDSEAAPVVIAKAEAAPAPQAPAPAPASAPKAPLAAAAATDLDATVFSSGRIANYVPESFRKSPAAENAVAEAAPAPAVVTTAKVAAQETPAPKASVEAYNPARDLWWDGKKRLNWAQMDKNKVTLGLPIPEKANATQLKPLNDRIGAAVATLEGRVRLQKAINATAAKLDGFANGESPSVFQDGTLGSRTKSAAYFYFAHHRREFEESLRQQGLLQ